jgi:hypothetical protein
LYAECLEKKLRKQKEKDSALFMAAVGEWLIVMRGERGDEKGLTNSSGLGIPGFTYLYRDEDRAIPARQHLMSLVGYLPKGWETDQKYMRKVAKQAEAIVNGRILKKSEVGIVKKESGPSESPLDPNAKINSHNNVRLTNEGQTK